MERIHVNVPEQPPAGSVVLDEAGTAWQAKSMPPSPKLTWWCAADSSNNVLRWAHLLTEHGPLDLVHRTEAT